MKINSKTCFFETLKGKIVFITFFFLFVLMGVLSIFSYASYKYDRKIIITTCDYTITSFVAEKVNKDVIKYLDRAQNLAIIGELLYKINKTTPIFYSDIPISSVISAFGNTNEVFGGGLFYEKEALNLSKPIYFYASKRSQRLVLVNDEVLGRNYNPEDRPWYKDIKPKLKKGNFVWAAPYRGKNTKNDILMTSVGVGIYDNDKLVGISMIDWDFNNILNKIMEVKPTQNSLVLLADTETGQVISSETYYSDSIARRIELKDIPWYREDLKNTDTLQYNGVDYIAYIKPLGDGKSLYVCVPEKELFAFIVKQLLNMFAALFVISILLSLTLFVILKRSVNAPIDNLSQVAKEIGSGNLDVKIDIKEPREFANLATVFNKMTDDIKEYIKNIRSISLEKEKIESELNIARQIQYSVLPNNFYTDIEEFDIYASMETAKEVGGDFYDFFFVDKNKLIFLIADVSGKGVPAALFMMTTKTLIKNIAYEKLSPGEFISKVNRTIFEDNKQEFFVTALIGILDLETGELTYINAGHNPPLLKRKDEKFEYVKLDPNLVLGIVEDAEYVCQKTVLNEGDILFTYTDGVVEATNPNSELFGENRLYASLNVLQTDNLTAITNAIKKDVKNFQGIAPTADDITILALKFNKKSVKI